MTDWTAFAFAVSLLALAVAFLGGEEDLTDERLTALPWHAIAANAALSQAAVGGLTLAAVHLSGVPIETLGVRAGTVRSLALGVGLGLALAVVNESVSVLAERSGVAYSESLKKLLTPTSTGGWAALLCLVLPLVAVVEELLFRGALVLALAAGLGLPPWPLAFASSALFGLAHGAQGKAGSIAAAGFGFALAGAALLTDGLLVPIVAHYVVNAVEFVGPFRALRR